MTDLTKLTLSEARDVVAPQRMLCSQRRESPSPGRGGVRGGVTSLAEGRNIAQIFFPIFVLEEASQSIGHHPLCVTPTPNPSPQGGGVLSSAPHYQNKST